MKKILSGLFSLLLLCAFSASVHAYSFIPIDYPDAVDTYAWSINNPVEIVCDYLDSSENWHGFVYYKGTFSSIDYPNADGTFAFDINDRGEIVGYYRDSSRVHGFLAK